MNPIQELLIQVEEQDLWAEDIILSRNEFLAVPGKINTNVYVVLEGSLRVFVMDEEEEHTIRFGYQNSFLGALDSFFSDEPTRYSIQAIKKAKLKVISKADFMQLVDSSSENQHLWNMILGQLITQQMEREIDLLTSSPNERYQRVLKRSPQLFQEIPLKYIASYLRMTAETLSRIKKS